MKLKQFQTLAILFVSILVFTSCSKKDREPTLVVVVKNYSGENIEGASVHVWPTDQLVIDSTSSGVFDENMDKWGTTDSRGEVAFCFPFSAVLDIDVKHTLVTSDTTLVLEGTKVVKVEVIEQKEEENIFEEIVYIK